MRYALLLPAAIAAALLGACGEDNTTTAPQSTAPAMTTRSPSEVTTHPTSSTQAATEAASRATTQTAAATEAAATAGASAQQQADSLISQITTYIRDQKWDLADKALNQLDELKPKLPASYGPRIDQLRQTINTAKATGGLKMPKMPGQ